MRRGDVAVQGTRRTKPIALCMGFASAEFSYSIDMGVPSPSDSAFSLDPVIKA